MSLIHPLFRTVSVVSVACMLSACSFAEPTLQQTLELELAVPANASVEMKLGAGPLEVVGDDGDTIRVEAGIYQTVASDDYRLALEPHGGDGARLIAETSSNAFGASDYIDLSVRVPHSVLLRIDDGSGSIRIRDVSNSLDITDGSGSISILSVGGDLSVDDGSGSLSVEGVGGNVTIDDGSGSITVIEVGGTVTVSDGSGSITVRDAGDFDLLDDGSGSVNLSGIRSSSM